MSPSETAPPSWLRSITNAALGRYFDLGSVQRGIRYAEQGRVSEVQYPSLREFTARVQGTTSRPYRVSVGIPGMPKKPELLAAVQVQPYQLTMNCSCPVGTNCKHCIAAVVHVRDLAEPASRPQQQKSPDWQGKLARLLDLEAEPDGRTGESLGLQYEFIGSDVTLRLLRQGRTGRGTWVRGNLTFDNLQWNHMGLDRVQARALTELAEQAAETAQSSLYYQRDRREIALSGIGQSGWALLQRAIDAGVTMVPARRFTTTVRFRGPEAELVARLRNDPDGGLQLEIAFRLDGQWVKPFTLLGHPAHGLVLVSDDDEVVVVGLARALPQREAGLATMAALHIPSDEVEAFSLRFLPRLRQRVTVEVDDGVNLPDLEGPRVLLEVTTSTAGPKAPVSTRIAVGYRYGSRDSGLDVTAHGGRDLALRDPDAEAALRPVVDEALQSAAFDLDRLPAEATVVGQEALRLLSHLNALPERDDLVVVQHGDQVVPRELVGGDLQLDLTENTDWFDLAIELNIEGVQVPLADLLVALAHGNDHLLMANGDWISLDNPDFDRLRELLAEAHLTPVPGSEQGDGSLRLRVRPEHASWVAELEQLGVVRREAEAWRAASDRMLGAVPVEEVAAPAALQATLRPYQLVGMRWMHFLHSCGLGGILADDMGLGKTLQAIALVAALVEREELTGRVLVVVPSSVVGGWQEQFAQFAPSLRVTAVGETTRRHRRELAEVVGDAQVVVTSYAVARLDQEHFATLDWQLVLLDEAQFVKNPASVTYRAIRQIPSRSRFALTGTPMENSLTDLWSLLSLTVPGLFPEMRDFNESYARPIRQGGEEVPELLARLQRRIRPVMLRRTKESVAPELPPKQEQVVQVALVPAHRKVYDRELTAVRKQVLGLLDDVDRNRVAILGSLTRLRQLSLAAELHDSAHAGMPSAKIEALLEMLDDVLAAGHRALVFSSFTGFLKLVQRHLASEKIRTSYLDGRTRNRQQRIDEFRSGASQVFLISLKAGGFGLNLTEADYVFVMDPWWNPAAEAQAIDRAHRIGQTQSVMVYRLVSEDTIEAKVLALQDRKRDLFAQVVDGGNAAVTGALTADDLRALFG